MTRFVVRLDDDEQPRSAIEVDRDGLERAVLDHLQEAAVVSLTALRGSAGRHAVQVEVQDRATGEWKLCVVTVSLSVIEGRQSHH